jgi:hypothetical protein
VSLRGSLYRSARVLGDAEALASGNRKRIARVNGSRGGRRTSPRSGAWPLGLLALSLALNQAATACLRHIEAVGACVGKQRENDVLEIVLAERADGDNGVEGRLLGEQGIPEDLAILDSSRE